jgi:hypothetical protein
VIAGLIRFALGRALGSWSRVLQLGFLMAVPLVAVATVAVYLKLDPQRWLAVVGASTGVLATAKSVTYLRSRRQRRRQPPPEEIESAPATGDPAS